jgi:hypothetical protein
VDRSRPVQKQRQKQKKSKKMSVLFNFNYTDKKVNFILLKVYLWVWPLNKVYSEGSASQTGYTFSVYVSNTFFPVSHALIKNIKKSDRSNRFGPVYLLFGSVWTSWTDCQPKKNNVSIFSRDVFNTNDLVVNLDEDNKKSWK